MRGLGRHGNDKDEGRCKKRRRRRESNGEIRLRVLVGMGGRHERKEKSN